MTEQISGAANGVRTASPAAPAHLAPGAERGPLRLTRSAVMSREAVNAKARTVELSFSSEEPYERYFGLEILGHGPGECDLSWLATGRAPVLVDHSPKDLVGIVERAEIGADRKGRAVVRFGVSARAEEVFGDIKGGIRVNVSVGYEIDELVLQGQDGDVDTYRVTKWRPIEISLVSIPADMTVGVGKSREERAAFLRGYSVAIPQHPPTEKIMTTETTTATAAQAASAETRAERDRVSNIMALAERWNMREFGADHVRQGTSLENFRGLVLARIPQQQPLYAPPSAIGLDQRETNRWSLLRHINAQFERQRGSGRPTEDDSLEVEASNAIAARLGRRPRGLYVPAEVLRASAGVSLHELQNGIAEYRTLQQRDLLVGTPTAGGNLVATNLLASSFIDILRNRMMVRTMGATFLPGLVGNVAIPKQTGAATVAWVAENAAPAESQQTVGQVALAPKTVTGFTDFSRQLMLQSTPAIEQFVRADLAAITALAIDLAALHGSGASNQPTGIASTAGIGSVAGGTNGAAPTWDNIVDLEAAVANSNADIGALGYLTNSKVRAKLKRTQRFAGTNGEPIWSVDAMGEPGMGVMNGSRAGVSNQVSSTLTKGTSNGICSAIFYGNWSDLLIGEWGVLDILVNPFALADQGAVRVHVFQTVDVAVRQAPSFAAMLDALTT